MWAVVLVCFANCCRFPNQIEAKPEAESRRPTACEMEADRSNSLAGICRGSPGIVANQPGTIHTGARSPGVPMGPGLVLHCPCRARLRCTVCSCTAVRLINEVRASTADAYKTVAPIGLQLAGFKGTPPALASDGPAQDVGSDEPAAGGVQRS